LLAAGDEGSEDGLAGALVDEELGIDDFFEERESVR